MRFLAALALALLASPALAQSNSITIVQQWTILRPELCFPIAPGSYHCPQTELDSMAGRTQLMSCRGEAPDWHDCDPIAGSQRIQSTLSEFFPNAPVCPCPAGAAPANIAEIDLERIAVGEWCIWDGAFLRHTVVIDYPQPLGRLYQFPCWSPVRGPQIFASSFEGGDLSRWSSREPPEEIDR